MKIPQPKFSLLALIIIIFVGVAFLVFNPTGYIKMAKLQKDLDKLNLQIDSLRKENEVLRLTNDSLSRGDLNKINRTAREKYDMHKPNEVVLKIEEK